jgi:hypothetical protein
MTTPTSQRRIDRGFKALEDYAAGECVSMSFTANTVDSNL